MADSTFITKDLLSELGACAEVRYDIRRLNLWDKPVCEVLDALEQDGNDGNARAWWKEQEVTEKFIRLTGSVITMNEKFKVFNPLTGQHEEFLDINTARTRMLEIATQVFHNYSPRIVTELINENGDGTWIDTDEHLKITAIISSES